MLEGYVPSYDATSVAKLLAQGAVIIGKTNMDEFGMGSTTETSGYKVTRNPRDPSRSPGLSCPAAWESPDPSHQTAD